MPGTDTACMPICMQSTSVRIDAATHEELKRLAAELNTTVGNAVTLAVRALRQDVVGAELATPRTFRDGSTPSASITSAAALLWGFASSVLATLGRYRSLEPLR